MDQAASLVDQLVKALDAKTDGPQPDGSYVWTFTPKMGEPDNYGCVITEATEIHTFVPTGNLAEDMEAVERISDSEFDAIREEIVYNMHIAEDRLWEQFFKGVSVEPTKPGLYSQNYKSALFDKYGKMVKVIE